VGFALSCYPVAVENGWLRRADALERTLRVLRFFCQSEQSTARDATGHRGFFYHFLDMESGRRAWSCELSTIDSALLFYGALTTAEYFGNREVSERSEFLLARADWIWACNKSPLVALAWKPERGFLHAHWSGYNEALLLYILALGNPQHELPKSSYAAWCSSYRWKSIYGSDFLYAGPLFVHQFPHFWLDLRALQDAPMRKRKSTYFRNTQHAVAIQREYCRRNPRGFAGYSENCWGLSAGIGPDNCRRKIDGRDVRFWNYHARGVPFGPDDGTLAPWAVVAALPFAPEEVLLALESIERHYPQLREAKHGLRASFNPTFTNENGLWLASEHLAIDQGPMVLAIENHLTGQLWQLLRNNSNLQRGLARCGFEAVA
jgi:hypothetical protein